MDPRRIVNGKRNILIRPDQVAAIKVTMVAILTGRVIRTWGDDDEDDDSEDTSDDYGIGEDATFQKGQGERAN